MREPTRKNRTMRCRTRQGDDDLGVAPIMVQHVESHSTTALPKSIHDAEEIQVQTASQLEQICFVIYSFDSDTEGHYEEVCGDIRG